MAKSKAAAKPSAAATLGGGVKKTVDNSSKVKRIKKVPEHPPVPQMVREAIESNGDSRRGSSLHYIKAFLVDNYGADPGKTNGRVRTYLKAAVERGDLVQLSGTGVSGSFKFPNARNNQKTSMAPVEKRSKASVADVKPPKAKKTAVKRKAAAGKAPSASPAKKAKQEAVVAEKTPTKKRASPKKRTTPVKKTKKAPVAKKTTGKVAAAAAKMDKADVAELGSISEESSEEMPSASEDSTITEQQQQQQQPTGELTPVKEMMLDNEPSSEDPTATESSEEVNTDASEKSSEDTAGENSEEASEPATTVAAAAAAPKKAKGKGRKKAAAAAAKA